MPRKPTPPKRQRAVRGSITAAMSLRLTDDESEALDVLAAQWECSRSAAVRRAIRDARLRLEGKRLGLHLTP